MFHVNVSDYAFQSNYVGDYLKEIWHIFAKRKDEDGATTSTEMTTR